MNEKLIIDFIDKIKASIDEGSFVKISLGNYKGIEPNLKQIFVKKILLKDKENLSFVYRYKTNDITKNYSLQDGIIRLQDSFAMDQFRIATLFTTTGDAILEYLANDKLKLRVTQPIITEKPNALHDEVKNRFITSKDKLYLQRLGICDKSGNVYAASQDKYQQINHYIEILHHQFESIPKSDALTIADMGSGKGYLTFALYDFLSNQGFRNFKITGIEMRANLVELCNKIASESGFSSLQFVEGMVMSYTQEANIIIALHACDTATDEALCKGIQSNSELIVVAPCCHKQIRRAIEESKQTNTLDFILKHGLFLERQAELITDAIRILILEYYNYKVKVVDFIADIHTPKNTMIIARKKTAKEHNQGKIAKQISEAKKFFGIEYHQLERLLAHPF